MGSSNLIYNALAMRSLAVATKIPLSKLLRREERQVWAIGWKRPTQSETSRRPSKVDTAAGA
jgi:hypothetical protein